ncbi:MAG: aminotransferase class V-fold PLP-dependent enzyme [Pirellulales bacterium]|nr:aminotransferase class V-fold PLP-dependent enzyme [Pirellulales bacterium]
MVGREHQPVYEQLGVRPGINAAGTLTRLGGSRMEAEVTAAMAEAARGFVPIDELQAAVGRRIVAATGAQAALVTSGAAAGLTLAAAACLAGCDFARMDRLPDTSGMPNEIVIPRSHRNAYDHALRAAGARLVEVGLAERTRDPQPWEIEAAIGPGTVAVAFCVGFSPLDLASVVTVAHRRGLPVIVDASAALPPRANLRTFIAAGADLVVFSGGKGLRGPQATGILCGRGDLIASAALQMLDLDFLPALWNPPKSLIDRDWLGDGVPNHGLGRGCKVGKEELVGLAVALERFLELDEDAEIARHTAAAARLAEGSAGLRGVDVKLAPRAGLWPHVVISIDHERAALGAVELVRKLAAGDPPVFVAQAAADRGVVGLDPFCLAPGEESIVIERLRELLSAR